MVTRVVTTQNATAAAFQLNAAADRYAGYSHFTVAVDCSSLKTVDYNWISTNAGEQSATNSYNIIGREIQIGSVSVTVLWGASSSHTVAIDATNDESDAILPSAFSLTKFSAGQIIRVKDIVDSGALNNKVPASGFDKRAYTAGNGQFVGYNSANTSTSAISAIGQFTAVGTAFPVVLNGGYRCLVVGTPLIDGPSVLCNGDSQIAAIGDTVTGGTFQHGIGVLQKATAYGSGKLMPSINMGRPGNEILDVIGAANMKWRPMLAYATWFYPQSGLNDCNNGYTAAQVEVTVETLAAIGRSYGCRIVQSKKTPISTGAWTLADGSDQTISSIATPVINALNAWLPGEVTAGRAEFLINYDGPVRNATNSDKWLAGATSDGVHENPTGVGLTYPQIASVWALLPTTFSWTGSQSGGMTTGGAASYLLASSRRVTGSGGITTGGSSSRAFTKRVASSLSGAVFSGAGLYTLAKKLTVVGSGGAVITGTAPYQMAASLTVVASGGAHFGGSADATLTRPPKYYDELGASTVAETMAFLAEGSTIDNTIFRIEGNTRRIVFKITDAGTPLDLSQWSQFELVVAASQDPGVADSVKMRVTGQPVDNKVGQVYFVPIDNMLIGRYFYNAKALDDNNESITFAVGRFVVGPGIE